MDVQFFKPVVDGTIKTFQIQASLETNPIKPFFKGQKEQPDFAIAGIIGMASPKFSGNIALCFPKEVFLGIMSKMLGEEYKEIIPELQDGAAELLNIIFGQAKTTLNEQGYELEMAIPNIVHGAKLQTRVISKEPVVVLPFSTPLGEFHIEISTQAQQ